MVKSVKTNKNKEIVGKKQRIYESIIIKLSGVKKRLVSLSWKKKVFFILLIVAMSLVANYTLGSTKEKIVYETEKVAKDTLITSVSATGTITSGNYSNTTTKTSGTVKKVYITNGDKVKKGQTIAEISLDDYAKERQAGAWVTYLEAKEAYLEAINQKAVTDISMWQAREDVLDAQDALDDMNENNTNPTTHTAYTDGEKMIITKTLDQTRKAFTVTESKYTNADADIVNASAKVASSFRNYQENSSVIIAPADGIISDLQLAEGMLVSSNSSTSSTSGATIVSAQTIAKVNSQNSQLVATVTLTEIDVIKVKANQKVSLTLDAYDGKTFTGKVLAVNTSGSTNSGVTLYPVTILLDPTTIDIYPNMAVTAEIISSVKTDILLIPTTAITTANGSSTVQIMRNGKISTSEVILGNSNDSFTEITSGLNEGDEIVTTTITQNAKSSSSTTTSPFSGIGGSSSTKSIRTFSTQGGNPPGF